MTVVEVTPETSERPERAVAVRRYDVNIEAGKGRTVSLRIAPFGEIAVAADGLGGLPRGVPYEEELMPGLYDKQLKAANRVYLNFEHQEGIGGIVGHGLALRSAQDGYHGDFRIAETEKGDTALDLVRNGVLGGASVESYWLKSVRTAAGVVQRVKAHLDAVALCRQGAYPSAVVTGLRKEDIPDEILLDEELLPVMEDPELIERCRRLGIRMPQRYQAHPVENGHPGETGTPEDGTRPTEHMPTLEDNE
jgi:HK97 family phage prohead protease